MVSKLQGHGELITTVHVADGKYSVEMYEDGFMRPLRYGEEWPAFAGKTVDNLTAALVIDLAGRTVPDDEKAKLLDDYCAIQYERRHHDYMNDNGTFSPVSELEQSMRDRLLRVLPDTMVIETDMFSLFASGAPEGEYETLPPILNKYILTGWDIEANGQVQVFAETAQEAARIYAEETGYSCTVLGIATC